MTFTLAKLSFLASFVGFASPINAQTIFYKSLSGVDETLLYSLDIETGFESIVGDTGILASAGLSFDSEGNLFIFANSTDNLYSLDTNTGQGTLIGNTGLNFS